jgi:hypothetical protein
MTAHWGAPLGNPKATASVSSRVYASIEDNKISQV